MLVAIARAIGNFFVTTSDNTQAANHPGYELVAVQQGVRSATLPKLHWPKEMTPNELLRLSISESDIKRPSEHSTREIMPAAMAGGCRVASWSALCRP
jgi:hypothetical protein